MPDTAFRAQRPPMQAEDAAAAFASFCLELGYDIGGLPQDGGKIERFAVQGDKGTARSGYYFFHGDPPANGEVGNWKEQDKHKWRAQGRYPRQPRAIVDEQRRLREDRRRAEQEQAAREARRRWREGQKVEDHPYLARKGIGAHGLRLWRARRLVMPVYSPHGEITSAQYIFADGSKRFHPRGIIGGGVYLIGPKPFAETERTFVCEGFATGASVHEATGHPVFVAFDANNLTRASRWLAEKYGRRIDVAGDDDAHLKRNVGRNAAISAARILGGKAYFPEMRGAEGTDFNDQAALYGLADVARIFADE